jgi:hypothetical protein
MALLERGDIGRQAYDTEAPKTGAPKTAAPKTEARVDGAPFARETPEIFVTPETISGQDVRPEWAALPAAQRIVLDRISARDLAGAAYARFRSFMFDAGFVPLRHGVAGRPGRHVVYARSASLADPSLAGVSAGDSVSMRHLGHCGRFANQLWQYLFVRMYGLRNGLAVQVPAWDGEQIFGFSDDRPDAANPVLGERPSLAFVGAGDDDLELWNIDDPPRNVDFKGYFQNLPPQWAAHRAFIRNLYTLKPEWRGAVDRLHQGLKRAEPSTGRRTLVSIHVRRGDYRNFDHDRRPEFRLVPAEWYRALLDEIWPALERPLLHVATDEPETILPAFASFEQLDAGFFARDFGIPDHVRDFVLLQEADILVGCNSSYSTMAAVTGKPGQTCLLADFRVKGFTPYDPWTEPSYCARFMPAARSLTFDGYGLRAARKRGLMMRYLVARHPELERDMDRLTNGLQSLHGGKGGPVSRYFHRLWRAVRGR